MEQGASKAVVDTGFVINPDLTRVLTLCANQGRTFQGGVVQIVNPEFNVFRLTFMLH
jgi:hypothetical protein